MKPTDLTCEYLTNPIGLDARRPRLSWVLDSDRRAWRQSACRIVAASRPELLPERPDVWDSGRLETDQSVHVDYGGPALKSRRRVWWAVRVWDELLAASAFSDPAFWEMGLLKDSDWRAQWILGHEAPKPEGQMAGPSPLLRKSFRLARNVRQARVYLSGLGYYDLHINGRRVGDHVLDPLVTRYDQRALYVTHDVTDFLQAGENVVGVRLGNGWYNCHTREVWNFEQAPWRHLPKLLLQLEAECENGRRTMVVSDITWKTTSGPVLFDGLRNGEIYDARAAKVGWDRPGYDARDWASAVVVASPGGRLAAQTLPIKVMRTLSPVGITEPKPGVFVVNMGQNITGWAQLRVRGPAGTRVTLRYAEKLTADGDIDQGNINCFIKSGECQTDAYILKGEGEEIWEPSFTYHGFQWVQVTGFPGTPTLDSLRGRVVHSAFETAGEFACSNELLNRIQSCARWAYIGNFVGIPTDCPHREKNGWTGDAMLAAETGLFNYRAAPAYLKWLNDIADAQRPSGQLPGIVPSGGWGYNWGSGPAWDSVFTHIPWYLYLYSGDRRVLAEHYGGMKRYVDFMATMATDDIVSFGLGDWCPPTGGADGHKTPAALTSTAYYYVNCLILARVGELLGKGAEARRYHRRADRIARAFNKRFYDPATGAYAGKEQTSLACALYQGLVEKSEQGPVLNALLEAIAANKGLLDYGILGAKYVPNALTAAGRSDVAFAMATRTDFPSYGHWLERGATTLWESWDGASSRNHIMFGDVSAWMFKALAGLNPDPDKPGFQHVVIRPNLVRGLSWVRAAHHSMQGWIRVEWKVEKDRFVLEVSVPANAMATVHLPASEAGQVTESGRPLAEAEGTASAGMAAGRPLVKIGSGVYRFEGVYAATCWTQDALSVA